MQKEPRKQVEWEQRVVMHIRKIKSAVSKRESFMVWSFLREVPLATILMCNPSNSLEVKMPSYCPILSAGSGIDWGKSPGLSYLNQYCLVYHSPQK